MITNSNIEEIIKNVKKETDEDVTLRDFMFILNESKFEDKTTAYKASFGEVVTAEELDVYFYSRKIQELNKELAPFKTTDEDSGDITEDDISFEENKQGLIKLLKNVRKASEKGQIEAKDAMKLETDIRVKLNDKFDTGEGDTDRHIVVVPSKHDIVCPHTNMECTYMPTKKACMEFYKLKDK